MSIGCLPINVYNIKDWWPSLPEMLHHKFVHKFLFLVPALIKACHPVRRLHREWCNMAQSDFLQHSDWRETSFFWPVKFFGFFSKLKIWLKVSTRSLRGHVKALYVWKKLNKMLVSFVPRIYEVIWVNLHCSIVDFHNYLTISFQLNWPLFKLKSSL